LAVDYILMDTQSKDLPAFVLSGALKLREKMIFNGFLTVSLLYWSLVDTNM
jgi:hypothetical protein